MASRHVVLGIFADEATADGAVQALKDWDRLEPRVTLDAIGVLVTDEDGRVKQSRLGRHDTGKGAGIGFVLGLIGFATAGVGLVGMTVGGAIVGRLVHKHLGLTKDDLRLLGGELRDGKAAVGVLVEEDEVGLVTAKLDELGGTPAAYRLEEDELTAAAAADAEAAWAEPETGWHLPPVGR
jgi:uncharacterized membrane protein